MSHGPVGPFSRQFPQPKGGQAGERGADQQERGGFGGDPVFSERVLEEVERCLPLLEGESRTSAVRMGSQELCWRGGPGKDGLSARHQSKACNPLPDSKSANMPTDYPAP